MPERVSDYPRPPRVEPAVARVRVVFNGVTIADTVRAKRVLETFGAPVFYLPLADVRADLLTETERNTVCEWKGNASYYTLRVGDRTAQNVGWVYHEPNRGYEQLRDHIAFYCAPMDACFVGEERARPQPGGFYGGWITDDLVGPFKGEPGTDGW